MPRPILWEALSSLAKYTPNANIAPISKTAAATNIHPTYGMSARSASDIRESPTNVDAVYVPKDAGANTLNLLIVANTERAKIPVQSVIFSTFRPSFKRYSTAAAKQTNATP